MANITVSSSVHEFMQAADAAAARSALSLGDSAIKNVGTGASQVAAGDHTHEGTEILSTNETGGVKFLREDGDGTCSWQPLSSGQFLSQAFTSQTSVTVTHNFGNYPVVEIIDNTGAVIVPFSVIHASINAFTVTFSVSTTGTIIASGVSAEAAGGGGGTGWTLIDEGTANSVSTIIADNVFTDTYTEYQLVLIGAKTDVHTASLLLKLRTSGADIADYYSTAGNSSNTGGGAPATFAWSPGQAQAYWIIQGSSGTGTGQYAHAVYTLWPRTGLDVRMMFQSSAKGYDGAFTHYVGAGEIVGVTSVDGFKITTPAEGSYTLDLTEWKLFGR